jgi:hypothetical protein
VLTSDARAARQPEVWVAEVRAASTAPATRWCGEAVYGDPLARRVAARLQRPASAHGANDRRAQAARGGRARPTLPCPAGLALGTWRNELPRALEALVARGQAAQRRVRGRSRPGQHLFERSARGVAAASPTRRSSRLSTTSSCCRCGESSPTRPTIDAGAGADPPGDRRTRRAQPAPRAAVLHEQLATPAPRRARRGELGGLRPRDGAHAGRAAQPGARRAGRSCYATNLMLRAASGRSPSWPTSGARRRRGARPRRARVARAQHDRHRAHTTGTSTAGLRSSARGRGGPTGPASPTSACRAAINRRTPRPRRQTEEASVVVRAAGGHRERAGRADELRLVPRRPEPRSCCASAASTRPSNGCRSGSPASRSARPHCSLHFMRAEIAMLRDDHDTVDRSTRVAQAPAARGRRPAGGTTAGDTGGRAGPQQRPDRRSARAIRRRLRGAGLRRGPAVARRAWCGWACVEADPPRAPPARRGRADDWRRVNETMLEALESDPAMFGEGPHNLLLAHAERCGCARWPATASRPRRWPRRSRAAPRPSSAIKLPVQAIYGRFREAEALVAAATARRRRSACAAHAEAVGIGLVALRGEIEALARRRGSTSRRRPPRRPGVRRGRRPSGAPGPHAARARGAPAGGRGARIARSAPSCS